ESWVGDSISHRLESADVVIQTDQPSKVATAISIGRATRRIVMQNIVGAITVKVLVLLAGACGFATLWAAAQMYCQPEVNYTMQTFQAEGRSVLVVQIE
ncbi:hypothetical protein PZH42_29965, partial [Bacteroides cellulosilyticus]